jgi:hypothetical protein
VVWRRASIGAALLFAASATAENLQPMRATLDQLRAHPNEFAGRFVELSGQVDECSSMSCHLCPMEATPAHPEWNRCLAIDFDRFRGGNRNWGADMDGAFRYADVRVVAKFDPTCLTAPCLDRASVLLGARVKQVMRRRSSNQGLIERREGLTAAPAALAAAVARLVRSGLPQEPLRPVQVFTMEADPLGRPNAIVCKARPGAPVEWPKTFEGAILFRSTEDRWQCWIAVKRPSGWALQVR